MKKLLTTLLIFFILCGNSFALVVGYSRTFGAAEPTTYFVGLNNNHTTTMVTTAPTSFFQTVSNTGVYESPTLPAGSTVVAVHIYFVTSNFVTSGEVTLHAYTSASEGGARYCRGTYTTIAEDAWVRTLITSGTTLFGSETQVFFGTAWNQSGTSQIGREDSGGDGATKGDAYNDDPLGTLTTTSRDYAVILEYTL